jgi:hypothetical protein
MLPIGITFLLVAATLAAADPSYRSMCFTNNCKAAVRVDYVGGATNYTCGDCPTGTLCNHLNGLLDSWCQ